MEMGPLEGTINGLEGVERAPSGGAARERLVEKTTAPGAFSTRPRRLPGRAGGKGGACEAVRALVERDAVRALGARLALTAAARTRAPGPIEELLYARFLRTSSNTIARYEVAGSVGVGRGCRAKWLMGAQPPATPRSLANYSRLSADGACRSGPNIWTAPSNSIPATCPARH
jgi:hypothetical protein